jgi:hypothetical protein
MPRPSVSPAWGLLALFVLGGVLAPFYHQVEHIRERQALQVTARLAHHIHDDTATLCPALPSDAQAHTPVCTLCAGVSLFLFSRPAALLPHPAVWTPLHGKIAPLAGETAGQWLIRGPPLPA